MRKILSVLVIALVLFSCGSQKKSKQKSTKTVTRVETKPKLETKEPEVKPVEKPKVTYANATEAYIANFSAIAMKEMKSYKIPASITLAQGILESGSGKGRLAVEANNHFGIKCHGWTGGKIYHDDDALQECFRKYKHVESSFEDHSAFLTSRGRYSKLFTLKQDDYKGWARGLRAAGYATDKKYPEKLISLIERYNLDRFDKQVLGKKYKSTSKPKVVDTKVNSQTHKVVKGDTMYSLAKRYGTTVDQIKKLNKMKSNNLQIGQVLIIKTK
ncbi:MAG: N-acetylmuramidase [Bacteroidetes bacterium MedPE-SWsnd-G2]|nr:MAG: N-acetylmuramidase [Bacteroidetes bacterium MedPE-SWsnd-G2]